MPSSLLIRADANAKIGPGHLMSCLALAQAWMRTDGRVVFALLETTPSLERRLQVEGVELARHSAVCGSADDATWTIELARSCGATWVVADGYAFDASWQKQIKDAGIRLLVIDDYGQADRYHADTILNQNASVNDGLYQHREPTTRLLLGPSYALIRREFLAYRARPRDIPPVARKILVAFGDSDPDNVTGTVIEALVELDDIEAVVVVGCSNPYLESVKRAIDASNHAIQLVVNATNMPELMAWADVAISAAGSTAWETACIGLPALLIVVADNQAAVAGSLHRDGASFSLGASITLTAEKISIQLRALLSDGARRRDMSRKARCLVDGDGAVRVVTHLLTAQLKLRRAEYHDCTLLWNWANDPVVRSMAFSSEPIPLGHHQRWFSDKMASPLTHLFVLENDNQIPIGQIRFDSVGDGVFEIDVSIAIDHRGCGAGMALLDIGENALRKNVQVCSLRALVKRHNAASLALFRRVGYKEQGIAFGPDAKEAVLLEKLL